MSYSKTIGKGIRLESTNGGEWALKALIVLLVFVVLAVGYLVVSNTSLLQQGTKPVAEQNQAPANPPSKSSEKPESKPEPGSTMAEIEKLSSKFPIPMEINSDPGLKKRILDEAFQGFVAFQEGTELEGPLKVQVTKFNSLSKFLISKGATEGSAEQMMDFRRLPAQDQNPRRMWPIIGYFKSEIDGTVKVFFLVVIEDQKGDILASHRFSNLR